MMTISTDCETPAQKVNVVFSGSTYPYKVRLIEQGFALLKGLPRTLPICFLFVLCCYLC